MHAATIEMGYQDTREPKECFGERDLDFREEVRSRAFERAVRLRLENKYDIAWRYTGLPRYKSEVITLHG